MSRTLIFSSPCYLRPPFRLLLLWHFLLFQAHLIDYGTVGGPWLPPQLSLECRTQPVPQLRMASSELEQETQRRRRQRKCQCGSIGPVSSQRKLLASCTVSDQALKRAVEATFMERRTQNGFVLW
jgi:hypothetical protein